MSLGKYSFFFFSLIIFSCSLESTDQKSASQTKTTVQDSLLTSADSTETEDPSDIKQSPFRLKPMAVNRISPYDHIIKKYSRRFGFDWRLIAAQIFAESHFRPNAKSHVGAVGLMQIMPNTAKHMKVDPQLLLKPEQNIGLGCLYDRQLYMRWNDKKGQDRLAFTFASYNAGRTRVLRVVSRAGSPAWGNVKPLLPRETRNYVTKIFKQYELYKKKYF